MTNARSHHLDRASARDTPPVAALPDRACAGHDPAIFFPEQGGPASPAKAICARCPHRQACLDWAIATGQAFGIWGGKSPDERAQMAVRALTPDRRLA